MFAKFGWFFELGYVTIIATIVSMTLTNLWKVTILKKWLVNSTADSKDKILGNAGTITSLIIYGIVYIVDIMLVQHTFAIVIDWNSAWISIVSGASVTWVAAKGLYTVLHKFFSRIKKGKTVEAVNGAVNDFNELQKKVNEEKANPKAVKNTINSIRRR